MVSLSRLSQPRPAAPALGVDRQTPSAEKPAAAVPGAPRSAPVTHAPQAPSSAHPAQAGSFFGRMGRAAFGAAFGAALLLGAAGCSSSPPAPAEPTPATVAAQQLSYFAPAKDGGYTLAAEPSHRVPADMARILDRVAQARASDDGPWAVILDPQEGSRPFTSPWTHREIRQVANDLQRYADSGAFTKVDPKIANAFFEELIPMFREIGPTQHAGYGFGAAALGDVEEHLLTLEKQHLEAQGRG